MTPTIEKTALGSTVYINSLAIGTIRSAWRGTQQGWIHRFSDEVFDSEMKCAQDLAERIQDSGVILNAPKRARQISEDAISPNAYRTDDELQKALSVCNQAPKRDPSVHPTATVSHVVEGAGWAVEEQIRRAQPMIQRRATTFNGVGID